MKRPPGLRMLLSAGLLCLCLQQANGLKGTQLIFAKSTTTSTTEAPFDADEPKDEVSPEIGQPSENTTKSNYTGNPQIDYILDPNLPRELNGYNLSSYPFYNSMPENIDFKCDGLHDGFYASVPHKCQVYHHCLFGTRYDFLCANYTAFDQKTFICHFVSEVDCNNSHKFWHRNDALYQAASTTTTTTVKPTPISISPALTASPRRPPPAVRRRRPSRRRPQYEYYDDDYEEEGREDYYEEPPRRRRKRPRPRPRPMYDDYDDYDDGRERRGSGRRNDDRREPDRRREYEDRRRYKEDRRRDYDDRSRFDKEDDSDYRFDRDRKREDDRKRRPHDDEDSPRYESRRPMDDRHDRPKSNRRPYGDESYEDDRRSFDRPRNSPPQDNVQPIVKSNSTSSIYNQPRMAPRIRPPVPKNEQSKFAYKPTAEAVPTKPPRKEDKYDDYDYDLPPQRSTPKPKPETERKSDRERDTRRVTRPSPTKKSLYDFDDYEEDRTKPLRPHMKPKQEVLSRDKLNSRNRQTTENYEDSEQESTSKERNNNSKEQKQKNEGASLVKESPREFQENVRIVKRPFLPSRGGNPFSARGLQPIGAKALDITKHDVETTTEGTTVQESSEVQNGRQFPESSTSKSESKELLVTKAQKEEEIEPSPILVKVVNRLKYPNPDETDSKEELKPISNRPQIQIRSNGKPKDYNNLPRKNPLDINESEYDVTLNDALNPTLPNLPIRNFPTAFSTSNNDYYNENNYNRPLRYDSYNRGSESRFQVRAPSQKIETFANFGTQSRKFLDIPPNSFYQNYRLNPQITQAQAHGFMPVY